MVYHHAEVPPCRAERPGRRLSTYSFINAMEIPKFEGVFYTPIHILLSITVLSLRYEIFCLIVISCLLHFTFLLFFLLVIPWDFYIPPYKNEIV